MAQILVCDDDTFSLRFIAAALKRLAAAHGLTLVTTASAEDCLARIAAEPPRILIVDQNMPEMSGFELIRRAWPPNTPRTTRVLLLSADIDDAARSQCLQLGVDGLQSKPISPAQLSGAVEALLALQ